MSLNLSAETYSRLLRGGASELNELRSEINDLNVFPIPDGDTGDNMYMTISAGADCACLDGESLSDFADRAAGCMLIGARGNSGVILSRIFKGVAQGFQSVGQASPGDIARAADAAVKAAYDAVASPVEGTILTVLREGVAAGNAALSESGAIRDWLDGFIDGAEVSLRRTPELLPVLAEAGVVDSGGAGLICIARGMRDAIEGRASFDAPSGGGPITGPADLSLFDENSVLTFGYCTEFLLRLQTSKTDIETFDTGALTEWLNSVGDSVVCFREGSIVKVHVHTFDPGKVLTHCRLFGEFLTVKIENMTLQHHHHETVGREAAGVTPSYLAPSRKKYGFVTVADGDGVRELFEQLGADIVIDGGQCRNPSSGDFLRAYEKTDAEHIIVLPNNSNIVLAAEQSAALCDADVRVLPTKSLGEGYLAMSAADVSAKDPDALLSGMAEAAASCLTCTVSKASRDAVFGDVAVKTGDFVGICGKKILTDSPDLRGAVLDTLVRAGAGERGVIMLIRGRTVSLEEDERINSSVASAYADAELIPVDGGQAVYDYVIVLI